MWKLIFVLAIFFGRMEWSCALDTIRIMYYNVLNFPGENPERTDDLRKIIGYSRPDIVVVNELLSEEGANLILEEGLNAADVFPYEAATFINGPDRDNLLYYNSEKLGLIAQEQIPTGLRDISEYKLFYKSPGLNAASDTIYLQLYSLHLKAGSGFFNQRREEALQLKYRLNGLENTENIFVGGDFNFYSGNESGCLALRETGEIDLYDPIASIGDWSNNPAYADIHTQSTRTAPLSDGSGGGMDDRFDLIFISEDVFDNANGLTNVEGSYDALGQDGLRYNGSIISPTNTAVPDSIANALVFMSDHLPVLMDVATDYTASILVENPESWTVRYADHSVLFDQPLNDALFSLYDLTGKSIVHKEGLFATTLNLNMSLKKGIYIWEIVQDNYRYSGKLTISK